jgi:hypothetical protein
MARDNTRSDKPKAGQLPPLIVGPVEINRLRRELTAIDDTLLEHTLRKQGSNAQMLKTSRLMDQMVDLNQLNLLHKTDRERLRRFLDAVTERAPVLHISFSADPAPAFLDRLMAWLRDNIHPQVLVTIGVQPTIAAGCIVRGPNRYFDFSLRQDFAGKSELLMKHISAPGRERAQEARS